MLCLGGLSGAGQGCQDDKILLKLSSTTQTSVS